MHVVYDNLEQEIREDRKVPRGVDAHEFGRQLVSEVHPELDVDQVRGEWGRWGRVEKDPDEITAQG